MLRETYLYKKGIKCSVEGCQFPDVTFHHTNYEKDLGIPLCWFHHTLQHLDKLTINQYINLCKERKFDKCKLILKFPDCTLTIVLKQKKVK